MTGIAGPEVDPSAPPSLNLMRLRCVVKHRTNSSKVEVSFGHPNQLAQCRGRGLRVVVEKPHVLDFLAHNLADTSIVATGETQVLASLEHTNVRMRGANVVDGIVARAIVHYHYE